MPDGDTSVSRALRLAELDWPDHIAWDVELLSPIPRGSDGVPYWPYAPECGVSVLVAWRSWEDAPHYYLGFNNKGEQAATQFISDVHNCGRADAALLTWNGTSFDEELVARTARADWAHYWKHDLLTKRRRVDLAVVAAVAQKSMAHGGTEFHEAAMSQLSNGVHPAYQTLVGLGETDSKIAVLNGWRLENAYAATFKLPEVPPTMRTVDGPHLWIAGRYAEVVRACTADVIRLREVYAHAWLTGEIRGPGDWVAQVPRSVL